MAGSRFFVFVLASLFPFLGCYAAEDLVKTRMERYLRLMPQEKVYLHFDNNCYYQGDKVYFSANVVKDSNLTASDLSKILYVELVSPSGWPVQTEKLAINNGRADECIQLADNLSTGFYEIRAFTAWMLNYGEAWHHGWNTFTLKRPYKKMYGEAFQQALKGNAGVFSRVVPVYKKVNDGDYENKVIEVPRKVTTSLQDKIEDKPVVTFYPESGNLIEGVASRVAFLVTNAEGRALQTQMKLEQGGQLIGSARTEFGGRGCFYLPAGKVKADDPVIATLRYKGKNYNFDLPKVEKQGYIIAITGDDVLNIRIARNANTPGNDVALTDICRGELKWFSTLHMQDAAADSVKIPITELKTGVNIFSLLDGEGRVLAQREVFVNRHDLQQLFVRTDSMGRNYAPYEQVNMKLQVCDSAGKSLPQNTCFSLSVKHDNDDELSYDNRSALSDLLLSSEIKGFIPYPGYYFQKDDAQHRRALDLLLMVQGWTRYDFNALTSDSMPKLRYEAEKDLHFRGKIMDTHYLSGTSYLGDNPYSGRSYNRDENLGYGYGEQSQWTDWSDSKRGIWLRIDLQTDKGFITGDRQITNSKPFEIHIPPFYGKGEAFIMMNRKSMAAAGEKETDITKHLKAYGSIKQNVLENRYVIVPMNVLSPLPKPYSYYETSLPVADSVFAQTTSTQAGILLPEVIKQTRRKWYDVDYDYPTLSLSLGEVYARMSLIEGRIENFHISGSPNYGIRDAVTPPSCIGVLPMLGIDGVAYYTVDGLPIYKYVAKEGRTKALPQGYRFLPNDVEFTRMDIFADVPDRRRIYSPGQYHEVLTVATDNSDVRSELSARVNFVTDSLIEPGSRLPEFIGNRYELDGISMPVDFYNPDYSKMPLPETPDYRRTLYWNPSITTDSEGRANVKFYTGAKGGSLHLSVDDITPEGQFVSNR